MSEMIWPKEWIRTQDNVAVWFVMDKREPTQEDYDNLKAGMDNVGAPSYTVDELTLQGRYHANWTTQEDVLNGTPPEQMDGGFGSNIYEMQNLTPGGLIADDEIWIHGEGGTMDKMMPPNSGLYYVDDLQLAHCGAEPGSAADKYVGDKDLYFQGMWKVS